MRGARGGWLLFFLIINALAEYDKEHPRMICNPHEKETKTWGPHNVLPNLFEYVYKPFLNAFTFVATCEHEFKLPIDCEKLPENGSLEARCAAIGADGLLMHYFLIFQYLTGWNIISRWYPLSEASDATLVTTQLCGIVLRRGDAAFEPHRECRRSTLAYQCVWHDIVWVTLPVAAALGAGIILLVVAGFSALMMALE